MEKTRGLMKFDEKYAKKRMKRFTKAILPILIAVSILYVIQYV